MNKLLVIGTGAICSVVSAGLGYWLKSRSHKEEMNAVYEEHCKDLEKLKASLEDVKARNEFLDGVEDGLGAILADRTPIIDCSEPVVNISSARGSSISNKKQTRNKRSSRENKRKHH